LGYAVESLGGNPSMHHTVTKHACADGADHSVSN
jgi:hypothetical protein